jgi:cytochrome c
MMRLVLLAAAVGVAVTGAAAAADLEAGKKVFARCGACHNVDKPVNKVGPHLVGLFGRKSGAVEGFKYSEANASSGVVWSAEVLDKYLTDPKAFMPGNRMAFAGVKKDDERANLIAYLEQATKPQ